MRLKKVGGARKGTDRAAQCGITPQEIKISSAILACTTESGMQCTVVSNFFPSHHDLYANTCQREKGTATSNLQNNG